MAKTLSRFYLLKKDENKDKATLFVRKGTRPHTQN